MNETNLPGDRRISAEPPSRAALALAARARRPATSAVAVTVPVPVPVPAATTATRPPGDPLPAVPVFSTADRRTEREVPRAAAVVPVREPATVPSGGPVALPPPAAPVPPVPSAPTVVEPASAPVPARDAEPARRNARAPQPVPEPAQAPAPRGRPEPPALPAPAPIATETVRAVRDESQVTARAVRPSTPGSPDAAVAGELSALLERARRAMASPPEEAGPRRPERTQPDPAPVATPVREAEPASPVATPPQPVPPPVTIGEIHIHEAAHTGQAADPLSLLTPYAGGLTARRGRINAPAGAR